MASQTTSAMRVAQYIDDMLEMIPQEYYFQKEGDPNQWKNKFAKNTKKAKEMASYKKNKRLEAKQHKKDKFDSVETPSLKRAQKQRAKETEKEKAPSSTQRGPMLRDRHGNPLQAPRADSLDDLRQRMKMRIQLLKSGRANQGRARPRTTKRKRPPSKPEEADAKKPQQAATPAAAPSAADVEQFDFNSFTFGSNDNSLSAPPLRKKPSLRSLVQRADEKAKRIQALKESGEAPKLVAKEAWNTALLKAKGQKPDDDVNYLRRKLKQKEKKRAKSAKEWKARNKAVAKAQANKQAQRQYNIANRHVPKADRINPVTGEPLVAPQPSGRDAQGADKSTGREGRSRPGFEGSARGFLNKPRKSKGTPGKGRKD